MLETASHWPVLALRAAMCYFLFFPPACTVCCSKTHVCGMNSFSKVAYKQENKSPPPVSSIMLTDLLLCKIKKKEETLKTSLFIVNRDITSHTAEGVGCYQACRLEGRILFFREWSKVLPSKANTGD